MNDIADNRLDANLDAVARTCLLELPSDRTFTYEQFTSAQACLGCLLVAFPSNSVLLIHI